MLVHNALFLLMRLRKLAARDQRDYADRLLRIWCKKDGELPQIATAYYEMRKRQGGAGPASR